MDDVLREALEPILRDLRREGLDEPRIEDHDWTDDPEQPSAMLWSPDGNARGVSVPRSAAAAERIASAADQVHEWVIEELLWGRAATNWPRCPHHPLTHPLSATTVQDVAAWVCPLTREVVSPVGALGDAAESEAPDDPRPTRPG